MDFGNVLENDEIYWKFFKLAMHSGETLHVHHGFDSRITNHSLHLFYDPYITAELEQELHMR